MFPADSTLGRECRRDTGIDCDAPNKERIADGSVGFEATVPVMTAGKHIVVFGGITVDRLATSLGPLVAGASNPGHAERRVGGVGLNVATILSLTGNTVRLVARVGDDDDGVRAIAEAAHAGILTEGITASSIAATGSYTAIFDHEGELVAGIADMAVFDDLHPVEGTRLTDPADKGEFFVVDANLPETTLDYLCRRASEGGHAVAALAVSPSKARKLIGCLDRIDWLFANRAEASSLLGHDPDKPGPPTADMAADLLALGAGAVIVTDGAGPLTLAQGDDIIVVTPPTVDVARVNGAGDSLAAGTIHLLAAGQPLKVAVSGGLAAAALTLEHGGIREAMFSPDRLAAMTELVRQKD